MTTPMMQQYREAKERHPGMLLLFHMGDFYEMFGDDAEVASRVLGLKLTSRDKARNIPMAGIPVGALVTYVHRLWPAECLVAESNPAGVGERVREVLPAAVVTARADWTFDPMSARAALFNHFSVRTMAGFGFDDGQPCLVAAGALLLYLQETLKANLTHLSRLRAHRQDRFLFLDEVTRRSLELTRTLREGNREGSLLSVLDRTATAMGARL